MDKKTERSWILYDCGNSAYSMAITTALFPVFYGMLKTGGSSMDLGYVNSVAGIIIALIAPILGTLADHKGKKKRFFSFFFLLGIITTAALGIAPMEMVNLITILFVLTNVGFSGSLIFYDAFLIDVTTDERMDDVSSKGFGYGYIASIIPFGISLAVIYLLGMSKPIGYQISFMITALWWGLFTIPLLKNVKQIYYVENTKNVIRSSFKQLFDTMKQIQAYPVITLFLASYFLYIDGVGTIIKMVVPYAESALGKGLDMMLLLIFLLVIQIIAFPFAILYGKLAKKLGTLKMIRIGIVTYIIAVVYAYFMKSIVDIFVLGFLVASAQGGIQALSRSYFAKIIPKERSNEFFGFYNIFGKFAAIMGPFIMSAVTDLTGSARISIFGILPLFILGYLLSLKLPNFDSLD
ncbi:MFS transporter [Guggenheimella bovis]